MLAHFVFNGTQVALSQLLLSAELDVAYYNEPSLLYSFVVLGIVGAVGLAVFLLIYKKFKTHNMKNLDGNDNVSNDCEPVEGAEPQECAIQQPIPENRPVLFTVPIYITIVLFVVISLLNLLLPIL